MAPGEQRSQSLWFCTAFGVVLQYRAKETFKGNAKSMYGQIATSVARGTARRARISGRMRLP
jgi:hypothetical protein